MLGPDRVEQDCNSCMCRLLSSFHTTVGEITIIATPDAELDPAHASKSVQMRSFNDPAKGIQRLQHFL